MPYTSHTKYKLPREKGNPAMQPAQSKMCYDCGKVTSGRHEGAHYMVPHPHDLHYIDEEGLAYTEAEINEMGLPINVSHTECDDCEKMWYAAQHEKINARRASERAMKAAEEETHKDIGQTTSAYVPKEPAIQLGAHTPIPEAHTPIAEAYAPVTAETE